MTDALAVIAASWGVMMALSPILQLRRILERRSSADISIAYLAVLQIGFTLWIVWDRARQPQAKVGTRIAVRTTATSRSTAATPSSQSETLLVRLGS